MFRWLSTATTALIFCAVAAAQNALPPLSTAIRARWLVDENLAPDSLAENVALGAAYTFVNSPKEYGPHWSGFAKRTGMITANYGVKSSMEAGFGALWGEDPRYERTDGLTFKGRLSHVIAMTFMARNRKGKVMPAYSRFLAIPGSSFLSNQWRPDSEAHASDACIRAGLGFLSRMAENAYKEFIAK